MVTLRTRELPLPASEGLWEALTIKEWHAERLRQGASTLASEHSSYTHTDLQF